MQRRFGVQEEIVDWEDCSNENKMNNNKKNKNTQEYALWYLEVKNSCHNWKITVVDDGGREQFEYWS